MIIHDADQLGLSQMYQLRGRVGRSNRMAYAFLLYKRDKLLREVAEKRLSAIREFTDLGSGFKIAMRDDVVLLDPPFRGGTLEKILPAVDKCTAPGGTVLCESETGLVLPAQVGGLTLQKQYKYGKVLLWKYTKPMQQEGEAR